MRSSVVPISLGLLLAAVTSPLFAQAPNGQRRSARGTTAVQRALENRRRGLRRALQGRAGTVGDRATAFSRSTAESSTDLPTTRRTGQQRPGNAFRKSLIRRVGPQTGTGRLGNPRLRRQRNRVTGRAARRRGFSNRPDFLRRLQDNGAAGRDISSATLPRKRDRRNSTRNKRTHRFEDAPSRRRNDDVTPRRNGPPRSIADRILAKRLAEIDRLRDIALRTDNVRLLEQADKLEQLARQQHQLHVEGTKLDAPSIFRRINPDADGGNPTTQSIDSRRAREENDAPIPANRFPSP